MVLINVFCAETGRNYDFKADENALTRHVIADMKEMIMHRDHIRFDEEGRYFMLAFPGNGKTLDAEKTLAENGIGAGDALILV